MKYRTFSRLASANDAPGGAQENSPMNAEATDGPTAPTDPTQATAIEIAALLRRRDVSAAEVADAFIARVEAVNPALNAIIRFDADGVRAEAVGIGSAHASPANGRTSTRPPHAAEPSLAHWRASSRSSASRTQKPPRNSLASE